MHALAARDQLLEAVHRGGLVQQLARDGRARRRERRHHSQRRQLQPAVVPLDVSLQLFAVMLPYVLRQLVRLLAQVGRGQVVPDRQLGTAQGLDKVGF